MASEIKPGKGFSCGFFNSIDGDRKYNADDFSKLFGGIISDGVYKYTGNALMVTNGNEDGQIIVGTGQAYFLGHWALCETDQVLDVDPNSGGPQPRRVAVVLRMSTKTDEREAKIYLKYGWAGYNDFEVDKNNPPYPDMENNAAVVERIIASFVQKRGQTKDFTIINHVGSDVKFTDYDCPYVTGYIEHTDPDPKKILDDWHRTWHNWWFNGQNYDGTGNTEGPMSPKGYEWQWKTWFDGVKTAWTNWFDSTKNSWTSWYTATVTAWDTWFDTTKGDWTTYINDKNTDWTNYKNGKTAEFNAHVKDLDDDWDAWYSSIQQQMEGDVAANLAKAISDLDKKTSDKDSEMSTSISNLTTTVNGKANKATTLAGYGITDAQSKLTNPLVQANVVNNLTSDSTVYPLSAAQGKALNDKIKNEINRSPGLRINVSNFNSANRRYKATNSGFLSIPSDGYKAYLFYQAASGMEGVTPIDTNFLYIPKGCSFYVEDSVYVETTEKPWFYPLEA